MRTLVSLLGVLVTMAQAEDLSSGKIAAAPNVAARTPTPELSVDGGVIRGLVVGDHKDVHAYKGIPFAAPPVGDRRWKAPQPVVPWPGVRDCFEFGSACPQELPPLFRAMPELALRAPTGEDCLYLNVWAPAGHDRTAALPVLYWIHGGGFIMGAASQPLYDGEELARLGCIVVSVNYRLGLFGFLAHPALGREDREGISGNYGLLDQIEGLRWVKRNIAAFGGDPGRVAIFGESAGGVSVLCLMAAPPAADLFRGAIVQSAAGTDLVRLREAGPGPESAEQAGERMIAACGLAATASAAEMRRLDAATLTRAAPTPPAPGSPLRLKPWPFPIGPIVDGRLVPGQLNSLFAAGREHSVPMIVGNTKEEMAILRLGARMPADALGLAKMLEGEFGNQAAPLAAAYPVGEAAPLHSVIIQLATDLAFVSKTRFFARAHAASGRETFRYQFSRGTGRGLLAALGSHHGAELAFLFQRPAGLADEGAARTSRTLGRFWIHFAATGNPNGPGLPQWPAYRAPGDPMIEFAQDIHVLNGERNNQLDVIDKVLSATADSATPKSGD